MNLTAFRVAKGSPRGMLAMDIFLVFGAAMATLAGTTLIWRGTLLDRIWTLNALVEFASS